VPAFYYRTGDSEKVSGKQKKYIRLHQLQLLPDRCCGSTAEVLLRENTAP
jgi:hypothetical protein